MSDISGMPDAAIHTVAKILHECDHLVVLSGAGISKESGIPTFRDAQTGLWARYDPHELATPRAFNRNPKLVWDWYQFRRAHVLACQPNPGHYAIAELENLLPEVVIVTQNTDGLHPLAGSREVIALHGEMHRNKCSNNCQGDPTLIDVTQLEWDDNDGPPECPHCGGWVRPAVVWFEENLPSDALERAFDLCEAADVVMVIGTSGVVQPAASLPFLAKQHGATIIEINPAHTPISRIADVIVSGASGVVLPQIVTALKEMSDA